MNHSSENSKDTLQAILNTNAKRSSMRQKRWLWVALAIVGDNRYRLWLHADPPCGAIGSDCGVTA